MHSDAIVVLASGTGKTAVYEATGHLLGGPWLVISPTQSLQRDQAAMLREHGHHAEVLNSSRAGKAQQRVLDQFAAGALKVLLLAPEQLTKADVVSRLRSGRPRLVVVDEAHCLSEWGHDFRPDYLHVGQAVAALGRPRVLALTATASAPVRADIARTLGLKEPAIVAGDPDRPALWLGARLFAQESSRTDSVLDAAIDVEGAVIVYAPTRRRCDELADLLTSRGRAATAYHAGLAANHRRAVQDAFLSGGAQTLVATSAFGMGVDRPDVRAVLHAGPPTSVEAYFQEAGRAGRDGEFARAELFFRLEDFALSRYFTSGSGTSEGDLSAVLAVLERADQASHEQIVAESGRSRRRVSLAVGTLLAGAVVTRGEGGVRLRAPLRRSRQDAMDAALAVRDRRRAYDESRTAVMRLYAETTDCRRRVILELLGQEARDPCGMCDSCDNATSLPAGTRPYAVGGAVEHPQWGPGTVSHYADGRVVVLFEQAGFRTLDLGLVAERQLLTSA